MSGAGSVSGRFEGWSIRNGWDFAGKVAGGGFAGAVGGLASPAGGTLAMKMGSTSTSTRATVTSGAITGAGSAAGSMLENIVAGDSVDLNRAGATGLVGGGLSWPPSIGYPVLGRLVSTC